METLKLTDEEKAETLARHQINEARLNKELDLFNQAYSDRDTLDKCKTTRTQQDLFDMWLLMSLWSYD
ncbi:MAG: hypothetical protein OEY10_00115 [Nitrosopumilus sp.]|nr:hypothetical protein [Nitrosopumilus sp.]